MKKLIILVFILFFTQSLWAMSSSSFLISYSAFKNHDYNSSLLKFNMEQVKLSNVNLMDKVIAAIITEDLNLANKIANNILLSDPENQESYIVKLVFLCINKKFDKIKKLHKESLEANELINFIFFNDSKIKDINTISESLIDIVISSFSNANQESLNYDFLLFYVSLAKIIDNSNDRATLIKGELFQNIRKSKEAQKIFKMIKPSSPYYLDAQRNLAINYSNFSSYNEALLNITKLLKKNNNDYSIKKILADFYRIEKKYKKAIIIYNEMISENKEDIWKIFYLRGICFERMDDWNNAEKDFISSLDIKPDSPNVLNYLAYGWIEREIRLDQSLDMLKAAYKANPESYYIIDSLAWAYFKKNNLEEAARLMERVIDIAPGEAISLDHLGDIYYAMDRKREAVHFWQQALELADPEDEIEESVKIKLKKFNAG